MISIIFAPVDASRSISSSSDMPYQRTQSASFAPCATPIAMPGAPKWSRCESAAVMMGEANFSPYSSNSVFGSVEFIYLVSMRSESRYSLLIVLELPVCAMLYSFIK